MAGSEVTQESLDSEIKQIDIDIEILVSRIASMETDKLELRRHRNALAPIAQLPPELVINVSSCLHLSHTELEDISLKELGKTANLGSRAFRRSNEKPRYQEALYHQVLRPPALLMSHVCHSWRSLTMGAPECWSRIQVCDHTNPELLRFVWQNIGDQLIHLEYAGSPPHLNHLPNPATIAFLQEMLASRLGAFKSFASFRRPYASGRKVSDLLSAMPTGASRLEYIVLKEHAYSTDVGYDKFVAAGTPLLRTLVLNGTSVSWRSRLLASPQLTHVELRHAPGATAETVMDFLSFLTNARQLRSILAGFSMVPSSQQREFTAIQSAFRTPISLSSLDLAFNIVSTSPEPLLAILPAIRLRKNIPHFLVICKQNPELIQEVLARSIANGVGSCPWVPPECIHCLPGEGVLVGFKEARFQWVKSDSARISQQRIQTLEMTERMPTLADQLLVVPITTAYRLPWSRNHIRALILQRSWALTHEPFWNILARQQSLEYVFLPATGCGGLLQQLEEAIGVDSDDGASGGGDAPFPGLRCIRFYDVKAELNNPDCAFLKRLGEGLRRRQGRNGAVRLRQLSFEECAPRAIPPHLLDTFYPVADRIFCDGAVILQCQ